MKKNNSPWIHQLNQERKAFSLKSDLSTNIAIVGGGIAGISTAFFILKNTDKEVVLVEAGRLAHGATGHNAGQVVSYFERPFTELAKEFGLEMAADGQRSIELGWELLDEMYTEAGLDIPFSRFIGYSGFSTFDQMLSNLENNALRRKVDLLAPPIKISNEAPFLKDIPDEYKDLYVLVPQKEILDLLETKNTEFQALGGMPKGVINSALFTEQVAGYLLEKFKDRFSIFEETRIRKIVLKEEYSILDAEHHCITAKRVVLCTNGFENIEIFNTSGLEIDARFHHLVEGVVGRMSGFLEKMDKSPTAISYHIRPEDGFDDMEDPYYYLTRREYEYEAGKKHNLVCLGGPQHAIPDRGEYVFEFDYPDEVQKDTDEFIKKLYDLEPHKKVDYIFTWHGLMGYTKNGVRMIGPDPKNPVLLYNLGCNGVGILPSIFGGERIADYLLGKSIPKSIFDIPLL